MRTLAIAHGESRQQAEAAPFGTTGATLGTISNLSANYSDRTTLATQQGEITEVALTESAAFILPGKTVGDNILMLARGEATV